MSVDHQELNAGPILQRTRNFFRLRSESGTAAAAIRFIKSSSLLSRSIVSTKEKLFSARSILKEGKVESPSRMAAGSSTISYPRAVKGMRSFHRPIVAPSSPMIGPFLGAIPEMLKAPSCTAQRGVMNSCIPTSRGPYFPSYVRVLSCAMEDDTASKLAGSTSVMTISP